MKGIPVRENRKAETWSEPQRRMPIIHSRAEAGAGTRKIRKKRGNKTALREIIP